MRTDCDQPLVAIVQDSILQSQQNPGGEEALDVIMRQMRAMENTGLKQAYELKQERLRMGREAVSTGIDELLEIRDELRPAGILEQEPAHPERQNNPPDDPRVEPNEALYQPFPDLQDRQLETLEDWQAEYWRSPTLKAYICSSARCHPARFAEPSSIFDLISRYQVEARTRRWDLALSEKLQKQITLFACAEIRKVTQTEDNQSLAV